MSRNVHLEFSAPLEPAYAADLSTVKYMLERLYDKLNHSPKFAPDIEKRLIEFAEQAGLDLSGLTAADTVVSNAESVPLGDLTAVANGQVDGTAAVASGAISRVFTPSTAKIVKSGVKYTAPAITGTWVNGYTFTIVNGAITAIAAS